MPDESVIGVDLGTTFSAIAHVNSSGKAEMLPNSEGQYLTPSAVYCERNSFVVGQPAIDAGLSDPERLAQFVKRHLSDESWRFTTHGQSYSAVELSAEILRKLKSDAELALGKPVQRAVITVPAYFGEHERRSVAEAAESVGINLLRLINEPTAAAIVYGVDKSEQPETVLFYDLGGGTFDVTVCRIDPQRVQVLASKGVYKLGGKDFDDAILRYVVKAFQSEYDIDPLTDDEMALDLRVRVIRAKHQLTSMERAQVLVMAHGKRLPVELTRRTFEDISKRLMRYTQIVMNDVLRDAGPLGLKDIDKLILVGGSSRMPMVRRTLDGYFGRPVLLASNPDEVVALGAAVMADRMQRERGGVLDEIGQDSIGGLEVIDVLSHSIGVQARSTHTGQLRNKILICRNTPIPHETTEVFFTDGDHRTSLRIVVYQGESSDLADCIRVGEFTLADLPPGRPRGMPIEVSVKCNENGIIEIHARDQETGKKAMISVNYGSFDS